MSNAPQSTPINLTAWQVRAAHAGRLKLLFVPMERQPEDSDWFPATMQIDDRRNVYRIGSRQFVAKFRPHPPGSEVWGREDFRLGTCSNPECHGMAGYSDGESKLHPESKAGSESWCRVWRQIEADDMPEWASRFRYPVVASTPMLLKDVSEADAVLCGLSPWTHRTEGAITAKHQMFEDWSSRYGERYPFDMAWAWRVELGDNNG